MSVGKNALHSQMILTTTMSLLLSTSSSCRCHHTRHQQQTYCIHFCSCLTTFTELIHTA